MKHQLFLFLFFSLSSISSNAENNSIQFNVKKADAIAKGGRLYDKWWKELGLNKPSSTHSAYPANGKKQGGSWRCKECHGWDYKGNKGAYRKGSHQTGIKGIQATKNMSTEKITAILKNELHGYSRVLPDTALASIANFLQNGQVDIDPYLNKDTLRVNGNKKQGKHFFTNNCKKCHGNDGRKINFKIPSNPEYLGTVATENPVETIHKFRNGNPGAFVDGKPMPNMNNILSLKEQIDLLSYLQTLPVK